MIRRREKVAAEVEIAGEEIDLRLTLDRLSGSARPARPR